MKISRENIVEQAEALRTNSSLLPYLTTFGISVGKVLEVTSVDLLKPISTEKDALLFAKFCQMLWEALPDNPSIRVAPFFTICDFAEFWCDGGCELLDE